MLERAHNLRRMLKGPLVRRFIPLLAVSTAIIFANITSAQIVATDPVGFTTLTVNAKPASIRGLTLLSLDLTQLPVFQALIPAGGVSASGSPTVLTFPAHAFTAGQFDGTHYLEITNGPNAGRISDIITTTDSNSASTITLADDVTASVTAGTSTIRITPLWTFATLFGANNSAGLQGGPTASAADVVSIIDPTNGHSTNYFYSTTNNRWQTGLSDATNTVIQPDVGFRIERKVTSAVSFNLVGAVKLGPTGIFIQGGSVPKNLNYVTNPYPTASVTLANSNLFTGDPTTGVVGGPTASSADTLSILNSATGAFTNYFYSTTNNRWQTGLSDASAVTIPDGTAFLITRFSASPGQHGSFVWYVPQPF